jgi:hypothetical protein
VGKRGLAALALAWLTSGGLWAEEVAYKDVTVQSRPGGVQLYLDLLGREKALAQPRPGVWRIEHNDFTTPEGREIDRTLVVRKPGYREVRLSMGYGRFHEGQPLTDLGGNAISLPPAHFGIALRDHAHLILPPLGLGTVVLLWGWRRARQRQELARQAQLKAEKARQQAELEKERQLAAQARAEQQRQQAELAERKAEAEMAELRQRNLAFQAGAGKDPWLGYKINDYYMLAECIGKGAQGSVYKAQRVKDHPHAPEIVAVKIVDLADPSNNDQETEDRKVRLRNEITQGQKLVHKNWVRYFSGGELPQGFGFIILEFIEGKTTMKSLIRPDGMALEEACRILEPLVDGLDFAHGLGIVHRDLKPENVFVTPSGELKIGDLGLAKNLAQTNNTATGMFLGTPVYCAPEQFLDSKAATPHMDQYTVGIMAYELLSGHPPFQGDLNTLIMSRLQGTPPPLAHQSQAVNAILGKILDRDPARRFPTLREAFSALKSQV